MIMLKDRMGEMSVCSYVDRKCVVLEQTTRWEDSDVGG